MMRKILGYALTLVALMGMVMFNHDARHAQAQNPFPYMPIPQWSYDGSRVAVVNDSAIVIYDVPSGTLLHRLEEHTDTILSANWSPVDFRLASSSFDQTVKVWDGDTGILLNNLTGHDEEVVLVIWSPDGRRLISSDLGMDTTPDFFVWNPQTGVIELRFSHGFITDAAFSPNGEMFAISHALSLSVYDGETFQPIIRQPTTLCCANRMESLAWSPDGSQIVTGSTNGLITVWNAATLTQINQFPANAFYDEDGFDIPDLNLSFVRDAVFDTDETIQAISGDGTVRLWTQDGRLLRETQIERIDTAAWSPYGGRLAIQAPFAQRQSLSQEGEGYQAIRDDRLNIITPFASLERLQAIAEACGVPLAVEQQLHAARAEVNITNMITQIETLPADAIPPACRADLLAVAEAIADH